MRPSRLVSGLGLVLFAAPVGAVTPFGSLSVSADVSVVRGNTLLSDQEVALDDLAGGISALPLGALPEDADLEGYHAEPNGDHLIAFDVTVLLPGGLRAEPRDVVRFDGVQYSLEFDGSLAGVPKDAGIDAITRNGAGELLLSFDTSVRLSGLQIDDEDLARYLDPGFALAFDASAAAQPVPEDLDLDAAHWLSNDHLVASFDSHGNFGGFLSSDEDLVEFDPGAGTWSLAFDGSAAAAPWPGDANLDAVALPEPGALALLSCGGALLVRLALRRRRA